MPRSCNQILEAEAAIITQELKQIAAMARKHAIGHYIYMSVMCMNKVDHNVMGMSHGFPYEVPPTDSAQAILKTLCV